MKSPKTTKSPWKSRKNPIRSHETSIKSHGKSRGVSKGLSLSRSVQSSISTQDAHGQAFLAPCSCNAQFAQLATLRQNADAALVRRGHGMMVIFRMWFMQKDIFMIYGHMWSHMYVYVYIYMFVYMYIGPYTDWFWWVTCEITLQCGYDWTR